MHANTLIELAMQHVERKSVRALAERMGVSHTKVSEWKNGAKPMPEERIQQVAKIAGQDPGPWLLIIKAEQEGGDLGREWMKLFKKLGGIAAAVALVALGWKLGGFPLDLREAQEWHALLPFFALTPDVHYAKFREGLRYLGRLLRDWLAHRVHTARSPLPNTRISSSSAGVPPSSGPGTRVTDLGTAESADRLRGRTRGKSHGT